MEQIPLKTVLGHMKNNYLIGDRQHGFTEGKSCLTNLVAFYNGAVVLVDKGGATDVICLDCKAFDMVPYNILASKWETYVLDGPFNG